MLKKLAVLAAALAVSAPAFADRGHRDYRHGHRMVVHKPHYVVHHRPVVRHYYRPAPRPVVVVQRSHVNPAALIFGAVIGAAIVHGVATGY